MTTPERSARPNSRAGGVLPAESPRSASRRAPVRADRRPRWLGLGLLGLCAALSGCGQEIYENRVRAANAYYAYQEDLNANLDRKWTGPHGVSLRTPIGFREIPRPKGEDPDERVNSRFTRVSNLPGLLGKWEMPVQLDDGTRHVAELFLLGNHQRFLEYDPTAEDSRSPAQFYADVDAALLDGLQVTLGPGPAGGVADNAWLMARVPVAGTIPYTPTKTYDWARLVPPESPEVMPPRVGYAARYEVPVGRSNKAQVVILCLYPARMRDANKLIERLTKAMEQLVLPATAPTKPKAGQQPGAPAKPSGSF